MTQTIPWLRVLVEGVVIVGSILLAFGVQAWWDEWQDRGFEQDALVRLEVEFSENLNRLPSEDGLGWAARRTSALHELLQSLPAETEFTSIPDSLLAGALGTGTFDRVTPVLDGLLRSGRWELIRAPGVREAVAMWERAFAQLEERQQFRREHVDTRLRPVLATHGDVSEVFSRYGRVADEAVTEAITVLRIDSELKAMVAETHARNVVNVRVSARLRAATQDVLASLAESGGR